MGYGALGGDRGAETVPMRPRRIRPADHQSSAAGGTLVRLSSASYRSGGRKERFMGGDH
jgi:hypothetical protein